MVYGDQCNFSKKKVAEELVNRCFEEYGSPQALKKVEVGSDINKYHLCLWIHDFATVIEADEAMQCGNVGHLMSV
ncbi:hypothetical protein CROQUDRAFT_38260 [Cronartium quercuum f. sp. fusiforme G11]|uniref:Uncharacterized protein n=1 Tax=Cronartium quercuum f. sp. fusiforme G11 TaxID=708437 RepID=A0A9P6TG61_9BASI|nr:hypothetical protein CROQUDRAFT_38260 [Cronartium quercuum f. sp. fusiforme G11]